MSKLLESKGEEARENASGSEHSLELDFSEDETGDITVNLSRAHAGESSSPEARRPEENREINRYFEEVQQYGQPNGIGNRAVTPVI